MENGNLVEKNQLAWNNLPEIAKKALKIVAEKQNFAKYEVKITSEKNAGFLSEIIRATIVGSKSSDGSIKTQEKTLHEFSVLCKMQVASQARREILNSNEAFRREISLYNDYLRELVKLQQEFGITEEEGFFNFPKCYYAEYDEATNDAIIVMNDLRDEGFEMTNKYETLKIEFIRLVMQKLAKLHALSFVLERKKPEIFQKYKEYKDLIIKIFVQPAAEEVKNTVFPLAITLVQEKYPEVAKKLKNLHENFNIECEKLSNTENSGKYTVICHGDSWNNNFMYKFAPTGPQEVMFLDWQHSKYASPVLDIVHFLFTATDKKTRDVYYDDLLKVYHGSMTSFLEKLEESVEEIFPITAFHEELKKFGKFGIIIVLFNLTIATIPAEDMPNYDDSMDQLVNPHKKSDVDSPLIKALKAHIPNMAPRLRDIILDVERFGYL